MLPLISVSYRHRCSRWLAVWLLWLLGSLGLAYGQSTSPFAVRVTPVGSVGLSPGRSQLLTATAVRPAFSTGSGFNNAVTATAIQPDGKVLVGGSFTSYNGATRKYLARLNADGSIDNSFAAGTELNGVVNAIAIQPDGYILIGGAFTTYGTASRPRLARISPTGLLDQSFTPYDATTGGLNNTVRAIAIQAGSVLVGGDFTAYGTNTASGYLVRLGADGSLDAAFAVNSHAIPALFNDVVRAIVVQSSGSILVGGSFAGNRAGIARLGSTGLLDPTFNSTNGGPVSAGISTIAEFNGGILVGGAFTSYSSGGVPNSAYNGLAFLDSAGELNTAFTFSLGTNSPVVYSIAVLSTNQVVVGGAFTVFFNSTTYANLIGLTFTTTTGGITTWGIDTSFKVETALTSAVYSLALNSQSPLASDRLVIGGQFTSYKGITASYIARLKPTGSLDDIDVPIAGATYQWNGSVTNAVTNAKNATAQATTTGLYSATATLTLGGSAVSISSNAVAITVAAVPLAPIAVRVTPVGPITLSAGQSLPLTAQTVYPALNTGTGFNDQVKALAVQPDGKLVVGGSFTSYNSATLNRGRIARLNADGSLDNTFFPTGAGFDNAVTSVAVQPDGKVLVGGDFNAYNSATPNRRHIARLNIDGSLDNTFAATTAGLSNSTTALVVQPDGKILVAGNFSYYTSTSGSNIPPALNYVTRLNPDGSRDANFNATINGTGFDSYTTALALQPDGKILVGGHFTKYNGVTRNGVVRLNADGNLDTSFTPITNFGNDVTALALQPDGKVLVGSAFLNYVVRLNTDGSLDTNFAPTGTAGVSIVTVLALQPDGKLLVGGTVQPPGVANGSLVRFDINGMLDLTFAPGSTGFGQPGDKFSGGYATSLALQPDGKVLALGTFTSYNGTANINRITRLTETGNLDGDIPVTGATYAWSNGSTGPVLTAATSGSYSATATLLGQTATSNAVTVAVGSSAPASFTVRVTPAGSLSLCASGLGSSQTLTAQAQVAGVAVPATYAWWQVQNGTPVPLGPGTPYPAANPTASTYSVSAATPGQYFATATTGTGAAAPTAASPTVTVASAPAPSLSTPTPITGPPGASVVLTGNNLDLVTVVLFGNLIAAFVVDSPTQLTVTIPAGATSGTLYLVTACTPYAYQFSFSLPAAPALTLTDVTPQAATIGNTIVLTGSGFSSSTGLVPIVTLSGHKMSSVTVVSDNQLTAIVPTTVTAGTGLPLTVTTAGGSATASLAVYTATALDTVINTTVTLPAKRVYTSLRIEAPGKVTISGAAPNDNLGLTVNHLEVQAGATLSITDATVVAAGSPSSDLLLAAGATLNVGHPNGLNNYPTPGAIQLQKLFFSPDASYGYIGSQFQATGDALPSQVRNLASANPRGLALTRPVSIAQALVMNGAGNFYLNNQPLTLLSSAAGTGLVVNRPGAGRVLGTATVQRYINPVANNGLGFRYYGSPVKGATAAVLAATVFDYDQGRAFVQQDTLPLISYGFTQGALAPNTALQTGRGYRAVVPAATTVKFTGTLTTGDTTLTLTRTGNAPYNGWHLVSNPYPAPLNWSKLVAAGNAVNLDAAIYVYESTSTSTGTYRSYVNGISNDGPVNLTRNGDLLIAMGQAFFVRVLTGHTSGTLTFRDTSRVTTYNDQASFSRPASTPQPFELDADLELTGGSGGCRKCNHPDRIALYLNPAGATSANQPFNPLLDADARNLFSFSQQTLSIRGRRLTADSTFAIRAIAPPTAGQVVPLVLSAAEPGTYRLQVAIRELNQLPAGLVPYLHDFKSATTPWINLSSATTATPVTYNFELKADEVLATIINRLEIVFNPGVLATTPAGAGLGSAVVFPNPTQHRIHVEIPAVPGATQVQATLFNALGQAVLSQSAPLPATGTALNLGAEQLAGGVYILRLQAGSTTAVRRVVLAN